MKLWIKILFIGFVIFVLLFIGLHIFVNIKGKTLLADKLRETFKKEVSIGSIRTLFPIDIIIKDIDVKDLFKINEVFARGGAIDILRRNFILSELRINRAVANVERPLGKAVSEILSVESRAIALPSVPDISPTTIPSGKFLFPQFILKRLIIHDSIFNFIDKSIKDRDTIITVKNLNINVENLNFPIRSSTITSFELKGRIPWQEGKEEGRIEAEGWLNLFKKDMQTDLRIEGIDGIYISPYYVRYLSPEKLGIQKASLNLTSQIQSHRNDLVANCHLELVDLVFKEKIREEKEKITPQEVVTKILDIFKTFEGKIVLNFVIKTKMDSPQFRIEDIKMAVEEKVSKDYQPPAIKPEEIAKFPAKILEGMIKGTTEVLKAGVSGATAIGLEIKKALEEAFKKEKKEGN